MKQKIKRELKRHFVDSTAIVSFFYPIYTAIETFGTGMSIPVSLKSRAINGALIYGGLGSFTKLRDASKKLFKIKEDSPEWRHYVHDVLFAGTLIVGIKPLVYLASGETDWKKIAIGTVGSVATGGALSVPAGKFLDVYRDICGINESNRTPDLLKRQTPKVKKGLAAAVLAASLALCGAVYSAYSKFSDKNQNDPVQEIRQVDENQRNYQNHLETTLQEAGK